MVVTIIRTTSTPFRSDLDTLDDIMSPEEAGTLWGCTGDHVRHLCQDGAILAKKIGKQWVVQRSQPNPLQRKRLEC